MDERSRWDATASPWEPQDNISVPVVTYGPWAEDERTLGLLGDVAGRRVLDLGCGEGENAVALAHGGAHVTGLDISPRRLERGQALATLHSLEVTWRAGDMHTAELWPDSAYDLILATYVLPYSTAPAELLDLCRTGLRPGGELILSMDHPLRACFWDTEAEELVPYPVHDYHAVAGLAWRIRETPVTYLHRPVAAWVDLILEAGFVLRRLLEPSTGVAQKAAEWPADGPLAPLAHIPHTLILIAQRPA